MSSAPGGTAERRRGGLRDEHPVSDTVKHDEAGREMVFSLTPRKVIDLLQVASPRLRTFIVIATQTALRRGAIKHLGWQHLDFEGGFSCKPMGRGTKGIHPPPEAHGGAEDGAARASRPLQGVRSKAAPSTGLFAARL